MLANNLNGPQDIIVYHELVQLSGECISYGDGRQDWAASREKHGVKLVCDGCNGAEETFDQPECFVSL